MFLKIETQLGITEKNEFTIDLGVYWPNSTDTILTVFFTQSICLSYWDIPENWDNLPVRQKIESYFSITW